MKKLIACVLSLSIASTLCTSTVCAAGVDKVENLPDGRKVVYVSSENIEGYKNQLLNDIEKYSNIENKFSPDGSISKVLHQVAPYVVVATLYSSIGCLIFDYFFEKNDTNIDVQNSNNAIQEITEIPEDTSTEKKIEAMKSLAQKFKRKYHYTDGTISSKKRKSIIVRTFLSNFSATLLSFFFGIVFPGIVNNYYHDKVRILKDTKRDLSWCENNPSDCGDIKSCGMKIIINEKADIFSAQVYPQGNCNE